MKLSALLLAVAACATPALAQFSSDPAAPFLLTDNAGYNQPKLRILPDGTARLSWLGTQGTGWDTFVQGVSSTGVELFDRNGILAADTTFSSTQDYGFAVDAMGNSLVAYRDDAGGIVNIRLQKISPTGTLLYGPTGIPVTSLATSEVSQPGVVATSDGGCVVSYSRGTTLANSRAWYQKFDAAGTPLWGAGIQIAPASNGYTATGMAPSDNGSVIVTMITNGSFSVPKRVHAQKLSAAGAQMWNGGTPLIIQLADSLQIGNFPTVVSDGANGVAIAWYVVPNGAFQCRVQRIDSAGNVLFPAGGATADDTSDRLRTSPDIAVNPATGEVTMAYSGSNTAQSQWGVYAQRFDSAGNRLWTANGATIKALDANQPGFIRATVSGTGAIVSWFELTGPVTRRVRAAYINDEANLTWPEPIIDVCNTMSDKGRMEAARAPDDAALLTWAENGGFIALARVNPDGSLGNPAAPGCGTADFDNDGDSGTDADIEAFFSCLAGNCCGTCFGADFDNDGDTGTDADIEAFFRVLAGQPC